MIYNYINSIYSKNVILTSILIVFYTIYSINNSNLSIKGIIGMILSLIIAWYIIDKDKNTTSKHDMLIKSIVKEIPILKKLIKHENILMFFYNNRDLINHDYIHYKKSVNSCIELINKYENIKKKYNLHNKSYKTISYDYDIALNNFYSSINNFKSMEFNVFNYPLANESEKLNKILLYYIDDITYMNNNNIKINGFTTYNKIIYNHPLEFNNEFLSY